MHIDAKAEIITITKEKIHDGNILDSGYLHFDSSQLPDIANRTSVIESGNIIYIASRNIVDINDGLWVISIDGIYLTQELTRLPNSHIMLETKTKK
ncbi:hypothetical protein AN2353V1_2823 [Citrobacter koseri]|nr:hypothetical protein AN2353V1_2823 [Citrobacter koseri]CAH6105884.1 hypothetical protein AN2353V1_2823 [Citrobacter koseri]